MTARSPTATTVEATALAPYVPRLVEDHQRSGGGAQLLMSEGTLVSADISGFTALSERLAEFGNEGAEQLTELLNRCFAAMIDVCEQRHGDVVKFGGDALLVLFTGHDHAIDAAVAMAEMHRIVSGNWSTDSVRRVSLGISQGAHSGTFGFTLADAGHVELLVGGPAVSMTVACEGEAERGQILVSARTAELLPPDWLGDPTTTGARPLRLRRARGDEHGALGPVARRTGADGLHDYLSGALAEQVLAGVPGEHRQVVVAFVNVAETDTLYEREGALAVYHACSRLAGNVKEVLGRHAVHLIASDAYVNGTKLIFTAGAPLSTDADDDHMLLALHDLFSMDNPLPLKAGVNRGHVFVGDLGGPTRRTFTVMGDAVNLAARLMQHAGAGQIVSSFDVLDRADTRFDVTELEPFHVKGKSRPIRAAVLGAPRADDADQHIGHIGFVGRAEELDLLDGMAAMAGAGAGCLVEVSGEPGIGKSRLVREVLQRHPELTLHRMRGGQYALNAPFFTIRRLLRQVLSIDGSDPAAVGRELTAWVADHAPQLRPWVPLLAIAVGADVATTEEVERLAEQFRRDRLISVTADALEIALSRPVAILAEDIHLFDTGSLDVVRALGARASSHPWFVVATHRGSDRLVREDSEWVELSALSDDELANLATAAGELAGDSTPPGRLDLLAARAGGNPLFLLELVSAARETGPNHLPETVESLVTTRIDVLPARDRTLLREVAVSGNLIDVDVVADAFGDPGLRRARRWEPLSAFLLRERDGVYRFRHGLYRDVAYSGLSYRRRREAHLAIGGALERRTSGDATAVAPLLSDHFDRGRDAARAWRYSVLAGDAARSAYANDEAVTLYERALRNADAAEAAEEARVAEALGDVCELRGRYDDAITAYQRSRVRARGTSESEVRLLRKIGSVRLREGELSQSLRWFTRARRHVDDLEPVSVRRLEEAEIALIRAGALHRQGRNEQCAMWAEAAARAAEDADDRAARARAYNMLEVAYRTLGRAAEAAECSDRALEYYAGTGDLVGEANVLNNRGIQSHFAGRWRQALRDYERSRVLRRQTGDVVGEALVANNMGEIRCLQNRFDAALELYTFARSAWEAAGYPVGVAYVIANQAMLAARSGDVDRGFELLGDAAERMERLGVTSLLLEVQQSRVECHLLARRPDLARVEAEALVDRLLLAHVGDDQLQLHATVLLALARLRAGDIAAAETSLRAVMERTAGPNDRYIEALCIHTLAELERAQGGDGTMLRERADGLLTKLDVVGRPPVLSGR